MEPIRTALERELAGLKSDVVDLGQIVDQAIARSTAALVQRNLEEARRVTAEDRLINQRRFAIEERALMALATQQPVASDLRAVAAAIHVAGELERMGDHAKGNARAALLLAQEPVPASSAAVQPLADEIGRMLRGALSAFARGDARAAAEVASAERQLDQLFSAHYLELVNQMVADPTTIRRNTVLLSVTHNLERIADRVTNVCERVAFMVTGRLEEWDLETDGIQSIDQIRE